MAIQNIGVHQQLFQLARAAGDPLVSSDAMLVPIGYEEVGILIQAFSMPVVSGGQEIEYPLPMGGQGFAQSSVDTRHQFPVRLKETAGFTVDNFFERVRQAGGAFDCRIYEGTPDRFKRAIVMRQCYIRAEPVERDWENRTQIVYYQGTLFGHYFREIEPGNAP